MVEPSAHDTAETFDIPHFQATCSARGHVGAGTYGG